MGKFRGAGVGGQEQARKGDVDWRELAKRVQDKDGVAKAIDKTIEQTPVVEETLASPTEGIEELAGIREQAPAEVRQEVIDDPQQYQDFQEIYNAPVGQGTGLGTGVGYQADPNVRANEVSQVNLINQLQERVNTDPNDVMAREQLLRMAPQHRTTGALDEYRAGVEVEGQARPGIERDTLAAPERLAQVRESYDKGREVQKVMDKMTFNMSPSEITRASEKVRSEENIEPENMNEVMNMFMSTHADVVENAGHAQGALADLALHAVMHEGKAELSREAKEEDKKGFEGWEGNDADAFVNRSQQARQAGVGRSIEKAMGVTSPSKAVTNAIGGFAQSIVREAFPHMFDTGGKLKRDAYDEANSLSDMTSIIMPEIQHRVRTVPKVTLDGKPKKSRIKGPRRGDVNKDYGDQKFNNDAIDNFESQSHSIDQSMSHVVEQLVGVVDANGETAIDPLLKINAVENVDGQMVKGTLNNREDASKRLVKDRNGQVVIDKNGEPVTEVYLGNKVKDFKFNETMDWARDFAGKAIFYDYFTPGNGRFFVQQTEGNFQSDKLARALLQDAQGDVYDLSGNDLRDLKAGVMLKFGFDKIGSNARAAKFDELVPGWLNYLDSDLNVIDGEGLVKEAMNEEGWGSVSAMVEGVKLLKAVADGNPRYTSKFYTEIDGVANGLGHNAMQAGDEAVAKRTNLLGKNEEDDVYLYNGKKFQSLVGSKVGDHAAAVENILDFFGIGGKLFDQNLRDFSKKPVMIFGYGAGDGVVKEAAKLWIAEKMHELTPEETAQYQAIVGQDEEAIMDVIADAMKDSVHSSFKNVKELSGIMAELTTLAVEQGIDPHLVTFGDHKILFGYKGNETIPGVGFTDRGITSAPTQTKLSPEGRVVKNEGSYDRLARPGETETRQTKDGRSFKVLAGQLKSATQSAVLPTHNNDGINVAMTFAKMDGKFKGHVGAQVFDGILTTPKKAAEMAKQLNQDFYDINIATSNLMRLKHALDNNQDKRFNWSASNKTKKLRRQIDSLNNKREALLKKLRAAGIKQFYWD